MATEIRIAGFGGQGVILATHILGRAASVHEGRYATMTQSFGPEARGGAASASLIVGDEPILYPYVAHPDVLVVMSKEAYTRFTPEARPGGLLLVEEDLVRLDRKAQGLKIYGIPATRFAEELGKKMVLNVIMTGFLCAISGAVSREAARKAVEESVPARFRALNLQAFDKGFDYGRALLERGPQKIENTEEVPLESEV